MLVIHILFYIDVRMSESSGLNQIHLIYFVGNILNIDHL